MTNESVAIILLAVAVVVAIAWRSGGLGIIEEMVAPEADKSQPGATPDGPAYLVYNQPWAFCPPNQNVMPDLAMRGC